MKMLKKLMTPLTGMPLFLLILFGCWGANIEVQEENKKQQCIKKYEKICESKDKTEEALCVIGGYKNECIKDK